MTNMLDHLKGLSKVVADTADFEVMKKYLPTDAITNPSLIRSAAHLPKYSVILEKAVRYGSKTGNTEREKLEKSLDMLFVLFGVEILKIVPGRVSTELDARLAFDKDATVQKAVDVIQLYTDHGIIQDRILIKIPATWEGIQAAKILHQRYGIHCNLTLLFGFAQAVACAEAGVTMISPYVGRILDWHIANTSKKEYSVEEDPGVLAVNRIYNYYKKFSYKTEVMAGSFRNVNQIKALAGCDLLTINPTLLEELQNINEPLLLKLSKDAAKNANIEKVEMNEAKFRKMLNDDPMVCDMLSSGIRNFSKDSIELEKILRNKLKNQMSEVPP